MLSLDHVGTFASKLAQSAVRPEGLATAGAMLTCVAIVLNVGPFVVGQRSEPVRLALAGDAMPKTAPVAWQAHATEPAAVEQAAAGQAARPALDPEPAADPEPTVAAAPAEPPLFWVASAELPVVPVAMAAADTQDARGAEPAVDHGPGDAARPASVVGVWSPDGGNCSARDFKDGTLPTVINAEGAWAGETFCVFTKRKETESGWRVVAKCSAPRARWTSNVRLTVSDNRLTWTSERGTQAYTRCAPDVLMAQAK